MNDDLTPRVTRRLFVLGASALPFLGAIGCKKEEPPPAPAKPPCSDTTDLAPEEIQMRQRLEYVDKTPFPEKLCSGCQQFTPPNAGEKCGGCKVVPGKIDAAGYCKLFVAKA